MYKALGLTYKLELLFVPRIRCLGSVQLAVEAQTRKRSFELVRYIRNEAFVLPDGVLRVRLFKQQGILKLANAVLKPRKLIVL